MSPARIDFQGHSVVELRSGPARALISPEAGGRLLFWEINGRRLIFWPDSADWSQPAKVRGGNPILFPFLGRHYVDGVIHQWRDDAGVVRDMPMHGFARTSPFNLLGSSTSVRAVMELASDPQTREIYPFDFLFRVIYELAATSLTVRFETENTGRNPLPYYAGHHFYFALPAEERPQWTLRFSPRRTSKTSGGWQRGHRRAGNTAYAIHPGRRRTSGHISYPASGRKSGVEPS